MARTNRKFGNRKRQSQSVKGFQWLNNIGNLFQRQRRRMAGKNRTSVPAEMLETRQLLSASSFFGDPDDQTSEVTSFGQLSSTVYNKAGTISQATDVDLIAFEVTEGQEISAIVTSQSGLYPYLRLFGPSGFSQHPTTEPLGGAFEGVVFNIRASRSGTYYVGISEQSNTFYNVKTGGSDFVDSRSTTGAYKVLIADTSDDGGGGGGGGDNRKADLLGDYFNVKQEPLSPGQSFDVDYRVRNQGDATSTATTVEFYASTDKTITTSDTYLGSQNLAAISAGGTYSAGSARLTLPQSFSDADGEFYVGMIVDAADTVSESDESNNSGHAWLKDFDDIELKLDDVSPDLSATMFDVRQLEILPGDVANVTFEVANSGTASAGVFDVAFYANSGTSVSHEDTYLGRSRITGLAANGKTPKHSVELTIPEDFRDLDNLFRIGMIVDAKDEVDESSESNNANTGRAVDWETVKLKPVSTNPTTPPAPPTLFRTTDTQNRRPEFQWAASDNADTYELWVNAPGLRATIHEKNLSATSFTSARDLPSGKIVFWVRARNAAGWGKWSSPSSFHISPKPSGPTVIEEVNATGTSRPTIAWNTDTAAIGYDVWITHVNTGNVVYHTKNLVTASFAPTTDLASGQYRVWARAVTPAGRGQWSSPVNFQIGVGAVPGRAVVSTPTTKTEPRPEFSWEAIENATYYELWVADTKTGSRVIHHRDLTTTSFIPDFDLSASTFRIWVRAGNDVGKGKWSVAQTLVTTPTSRPGEVSDVAVQLSAAAVFITWDAATNADSYDVILRNADTGNTVAQHSAVSGTAVTLTNDLAAGSYTVSVRARNGVSQGPWNTNNRFSVAATASVVQFGSTPFKGSTTQNANITWNAVPGAIAYEYRLTRIKPTSNTVVLEGRVNSQSFASVSFERHRSYSGEYSLEVRAITGSGTGLWSNGPNFYYIGNFVTLPRDIWVLGVNTDSEL